MTAPMFRQVLECGSPLPLSHSASHSHSGRGLSRIYAVGTGLALTLALSSKRGETHWPRWDESLIGEDPGVLESVSLSLGALGERVGVRASVLRN